VPAIGVAAATAWQWRRFVQGNDLDTLRNDLNKAAEVLIASVKRSYPCLGCSTHVEVVLDSFLPVDKWFKKLV
jgi:hypothetical protein